MARHTTADEQVYAIADYTGVPDAQRILRRILSLIEEGETAESIMRRLNPPAKITPVPTQWSDAYE